jgi:aspartate carbamoyltransferase catalytic subunit
VVNLLFEDSTRTRSSSEAAAKRLSAMINSPPGSSVAKGESLKDTALTLEAMGADAVVIRHSASGAPHRLAGWVRGSVLNAGDGSHEHPTQALLDAFTMRRRLGRLGGLRVTIVGDVLHSRVARSNVLLLSTLGADVTLVAPPTLLPYGVGVWPCGTGYDLDAALPKSDVVMMLRVQQERMTAAYFPSVREYSRRYGLDARRMAMLPEHALVMHPGPMNRGVEIAAEVADSGRSTIAEQVAWGHRAMLRCTCCWAGRRRTTTASPTGHRGSQRATTAGRISGSATAGSPPSGPARPRTPRPAPGDWTRPG